METTRAICGCGSTGNNPACKVWLAEHATAAAEQALHYFAGQAGGVPERVTTTARLVTAFQPLGPLTEEEAADVARRLAEQAIGPVSIVQTGPNAFLLAADAETAAAAERALRPYGF